MSKPKAAPIEPSSDTGRNAGPSVGRTDCSPPGKSHWDRRVQVGNEQSMATWEARFGVSRQELIAAVLEVGTWGEALERRFQLTGRTAS